MQTQPQITDSQGQQHFVKGMTLEEYMSQISLREVAGDCKVEEEKQQNLYESSLAVRRNNGKRQTQKYLIEQIDEESSQESVQFSKNSFANKYQKQQKTKETSRETKLGPEKIVELQPHSIFMKTSAYIGHHSIEKNSFRIKHVSNSPYKKKVESSLPPAALTLYGSKFRPSPIKQSQKAPELVTFYGKLQHIAGEQKLDLGRGESKRNFKKGNRLEINELIEFETKIKNNYSQKVYLKDIKTEGIKDRLTDRRNKLC